MLHVKSSCSFDQGRHITLILAKSIPPQTCGIAREKEKNKALRRKYTSNSSEDMGRQVSENLEFFVRNIGFLLFQLPKMSVTKTKLSKNSPSPKNLKLGPMILSSLVKWP